MPAISHRDASIMIGMVARGDDQHDIAAWFGVNQGRIADALAGKYGTTTAAAASDLPPKGPPGLKGRRLRGKVNKALEALQSGNNAEATKLLTEGLNDYNRNET